jgi:hypothetical protein
LMHCNDEERSKFTEEKNRTAIQIMPEVKWARWSWMFCQRFFCFFGLLWIFMVGLWSCRQLYNYGIVGSLPSALSKLLNLQYL